MKKKSALAGPLRRILASLAILTSPLRADVAMKTLLPMADAHVQEASPGTNAGTATDLLISSTSGSRQEAYLRYDLSGITGTIEQARLILWSGAAVTGASLTLAPLADANDGWSETGITWTNKPASLASGTVTVSKNLSNDYDGAIFDVTSLVADTLANDAAKMLSVRVSASAGTGMVFGARENGTNRKKPYLHLTVRTGSGTVTKLMHVGDSITRGANGAIGAVFSNAGWRYYLQNQLNPADVAFRCVGPRATDGSISSTYNGAALDRPLWFVANAGYSGESIEYIRNNIGAWIAANDPDVITLMIGTNNVGYTLTGGSSVPATQTNIDAWKASYTTLLDNILAAKPTAKVVMAKITPAGQKTSAPAADYRPNNANRIEPFNTQVVQVLFNQYSTAHPGQFFLVDNYAALSTSDIGADGVHPTSVGHVKLARSWRTGVQAALRAATETVESSTGGGAEAFVKGGTNAASNYGDPATAPGGASPTWRNTLLRVKADSNANNRTKLYLKFDLSGASANHSAAKLTLIYHGTDPYGGILAAAGPTLDVWGIPDGNDGWSKTGITWNNAPGNDTAGNGAATAAVFLGSISIPAGTHTGDQFTLATAELREFLNWQSGSDQLVTLLVTAQGSSSTEVCFHHTNNPDYQAPFLTLAPNAAATLADWGAFYFSNPANRDPLLDPDGDGIKNLIEYALGSDPTSAASGSGLLPTASTTTVSGHQRLTLTFIPQRSDVSYFVEGSNDLATWPDVTPVSPITPGQPVTFTDSVNLDAATRRFLRLKVTQP